MKLGKKIPEQVWEQLETTYRNSPVLKVGLEDNLVIFSDLHMGAGDRNDDFRRNGGFFQRILEEHYEPRGWSLILNGDVEELLRQPERLITERWNELYTVFDRFAEQKRFWKIEGNHDPASLQTTARYPVLSGLRLQGEKSWKGREFFVCHGHQGGLLNSGRYNTMMGGLLKVFANTLGIKNFSPAYHSQARYTIEERVYRFASSKKLAMIIGHTHRPLFETRSKASAYEDQLDRMTRKWTQASPDEKLELERRIESMKKGYLEYIRSAAQDLPSGLYHKEILVPCLFNSGCCIGKRGITALEISAEKIRLVHWADPDLHLPSKVLWEFLSKKLVKPGLQRTVIRKDVIPRVLAKIHLLAQEERALQEV